MDAFLCGFWDSALIKYKKRGREAIREAEDFLNQNEIRPTPKLIDIYITIMIKCCENKTIRSVEDVLGSVLLFDEISDD